MCVKYFLLVGAFLHWITALGTFWVGVWAYVEKNKYYYQEITTVYDIFLDMSIILMVLSAVRFIINLGGFAGALRENICLLKFFHISLLVVLVLEVSGVVLIFIFPSVAKQWATPMLKKVYIERYHDDEESMIDFVQETFDCCGVSTYENWNENEYFNCTAGNISPLKCTVPYSCCKILDTVLTGPPNIFCGEGALKDDARRENIYTIGCLDAFADWVENNMPIFGGCAAALLIPQVTGVVLGWLLVKQIRSQMDSTQTSDPAEDRQRYHLSSDGSSLEVVPTGDDDVFLSS